MPSEQNKNFAIIFPGRTGCTFTMHSINKNKNVSILLEPLPNNAREIIEQYNKESNTDYKLINIKRAVESNTVPYGMSLLMKLIAKSQENILRDFYSRKRPTTEVCGTNIQLADVMDHDKFIKMMQEYNVQIIVYTRQNIIKHYVSWRNLRIRIKHGNKQVEPYTVDIDHLKLYLAKENVNDKHVNFVKKIGNPYMVTSYEEFLENKKRNIRNICNFVGFKHCGELSKMTKKTNNDLKKSIKNYEEVAQVLKNTKFEWMLK